MPTACIWNQSRLICGRLLMALNLSKSVTKFLKSRPEEKFTVREIAEWVFENYPEECWKKEKRSDYINGEVELVQQLVREIGSQRPRMQDKTPQIKTTEGRPRKYYYTEKSDQDEVDAAEDSQQSGPLDIKVTEYDLYPKISAFLWSELGIYSKRIDERKSSNTKGPKGNMWLFPDIAGMEDLSSDWTREIKDCVQQHASNKTKLWSLEAKLLINRSNVRQSYFQAVSNSSWANMGYLISAEIEGAETLRELRILSALHGIGVIKLDIENPAESQIVIPAEEMPEVDWDTANRLTKENKDFLDYIQLVREFYQTGNPRKSDWDIIED